MGSVNKAIIMGNLGKDPEVRYAPSGQAIANFSVATSDSWTDKQGQKQEKTEWHRVVLFGKQAELAGEYLAKGRSVYIEGRIQTREWTNKENQKQYTTEIVGDKLVFVGGSGEGKGNSRDTGGQRANRGGPSPDDFGPPPPGYDDAPGGGGRSSRGGGRGNQGPDEDSIPF